MKNLWLRIGCFITGYNYTILKNSSEESVKTVKRYFSAILIISILWGFIGFSFSDRYLHTGHFGSLITGVVLVLIVIQVERQIILSDGNKYLIACFRIIIGILMAMIGSIIIDQIIFREDIDKMKINILQNEVNRILPEKTRELDYQIKQIDSAIYLKESERTSIINEISVKPFIKTTTSEIKHFRMQQNGNNGELIDTLVKKTDFILTEVANPKAGLLPNITDHINLLNNQKSEKENRKINARQELEEDLQKKTGFLDELNVLFSILFSSKPAFFVWLMFFLFFLSLELFVLANKFGESGSDYDRIIRHQRDVKIRMLEKLAGE